ncbi:hypothetical protein P168DRAFT_313592 [Aspergillus campestris IBT 28561]|uniref:Endonuclease/exonuclease/phosphatase domain-containing protein n=1 Tax=Aspergillus campestris (strain IBT 28561) TaxID=1392248 RepID=A0A2I1CR23_ASPC2|nr:uncharacterized protein P168DRAFT_313592 [Aspergillus campestris IBT 28561]PKY00078.1 hypothetical protein P168DRAFT_313592 [Aspergillus campestris IBT 28561]
MSVFSQLRNRVLEWRHGIPLPASETNVSPIFQSWHQFDTSFNKWLPLDKPQEPSQESSSADTTPAEYSKLVLATWNVDAGAPDSATRISSIISHLKASVPPVNIIFLQEVSRTALSTILATPWVREHWYSSEADTTNWGVRPFATMTLVSRSKLRDNTLGPIWRVKYPSRFERDALCCDVFLPSPKSGSESASPSRVRLMNVHLDSLPIQPSKRPIQLSIIASYLRAAGRGLVAGDFNPVLPEDNALIGTNELKDVWVELRPEEDGFTKLKGPSA